MRAAVVVLLAVLPAAAQTFEWWQTTDVPLFRRGEYTLTAHTQLRMRESFHDFFQGRIGPVLRGRLSRPWNFVLGYYFSESERERNDWRNTHRTFGGVDRPFAFRRGTLTMRSMVEHHFGGGSPQDIRLRHAFQWAHHAVLTPYAGTETLFDRHGFMQQRLQGGIRRQITDGYSLDIGYIYDRRQFRAGEHRHVIQTAIRPRRRER